MESKTVWYLKNFNLFEGMSDDEIESMSEMIKTDRIKRLEPVYLQGDPAHWIYFLKEGVVKLDVISPEGKSITLTLLKPGEIFGELALDEKSESATEAVALEECYLCRMSREQFMEMMKVHQEMVFSINKILGLRMRKIQIAIQDLIFLDVPGRLAKLLYSLVESDYDRVPAGRRIKFKLTHQELANLVGASREVVSVALGRFEREGLIVQDRRRLIVCDHDRLTAQFRRL